jgi:hypothetical protein
LLWQFLSVVDFAVNVADSAFVGYSANWSGAIEVDYARNHALLLRIF